MIKCPCLFFVKLVLLVVAASSLQAYAGADEKKHHRHHYGSAQAYQGGVYAGDTNSQFEVQTGNNDSQVAVFGSDTP